jgi:hypothetical protein
VIRLRRGAVTAVGQARPGLLELTVSLEGREEPAIAYPELTGGIWVRAASTS